MAEGQIINIDGVWTSKCGQNKINFIQTQDRFEGFVGDHDDVKITLGTISGRTMNFKQTWHKGRNQGAVATIYGKLTSDSSTILLEFEGMRANGRGMKGKNTLYRQNLIGSWAPMGVVGCSDIWHFKLENRWDITGYCDNTKLNKRIPLKGQRSKSDINFFTISLQEDNGKWATTLIEGEYRCPGIILALGRRNLILARKRLEKMPKYEEYDPVPLSEEASDSEMIFCTNENSFSSRRRPLRDESKVPEYKNEQAYKSEYVNESRNQPEDLRARLLGPSTVDRRTRKKCCCCF